MVDANGTTVPLSGIVIYVGLFKDGEEDVSHNKQVEGNRFEPTQDGVATFDLAVDQEGTWRFRALSDQLPELGPHGPEPFLFSNPFTVTK